MGKRLKFFGLGLALGAIISLGIVVKVWRSNPSYVASPQVVVELDDGEHIATQDATAATAYDALVTTTTKQGIPLKVKHYDFGVFVEQIGQKVNTKDLAWIYLVNGTAGTVAADKKMLAQGDRVSWRFMKPAAE